MFCPRCGSQIGEGLKFCKSCGLPVAQISTYVATGGTAPLIQPLQAPAAPAPSGSLTPKQQLIFTILTFVFIIPVVAVISEILAINADLAALPAIMLPLGIIWAVFRYKTQMRRQQQQQQFSFPAQTSAPTYQSAVAPAHQAPLPPPRTNPLADPMRGSVTEDETRRLPEDRR